MSDTTPGDGDDGPGHICGQETEHTDGPCQFPVKTPDGRCPNHPKDGSGPPDGSGSGSPDHHMGDGDGGIQEKTPEISKTTLDHGLYAVQDDPFGTLTWLEDNDPRGYDWIITRWQSYLVDAPFGEHTGKADDLLTACLYDYVVRGWTDRQVRQGLTTTETRVSDQGITYEAEVELSGNLPADRLARRSEEVKRKLGVQSDPESKKAEAKGWSKAAKEIAMEVDSDVDDVDGDDGGKK